MKRSLLAVIGLLGLAWQSGSAAEPSSVDAANQPVPAVPAWTGRELPGGVALDCGPASCQPCGQGGFVGGVGLYFIQPYFESNPAFTVTRFSPSGVVQQTDRTDLHHHMGVAPELWLGYIGENGLGARLRWWYFRQGTDQSLSFPSTDVTNRITVESAAPLGFTAFSDNDTPVTIVATSKLQLQLFDLEVLYHQQTGRWDLLCSGGLRLAHINQRYDTYLVGNSGTTATPIVASVTSGHSFDGVGPTIALEGRYPIADSGLAFFSTVRGALLFGSAKQNAVDTFTASGRPTEYSVAQDHRNRVMPVGELEIGVEYARTFGVGRVFGQFALVGQDWLGAGNASRSTQDNFLGLSHGGSVIDNDLGFFGFLFRIGLNY